MKGDKHLKILFVCDGLHPFVMGGMQKHSAGLVRALAECGATLTVVHCVFEGMRMPTEEEVLEGLFLEKNERIEIITLRFPKGSGLPGHYIKSSYLFSRMIFERMKERVQEYDFIYTKGFTGWEFIAKKRTGTTLPPIGVKFHGYEMFQPGGSIAMRLKKYILRGPAKWISLNADFVFSYGSKISEVIKQIGVASSKIVEIPTAIDDSWLRPNEKNEKERDQITFLFVGRYERRKGIEELSQAIEDRPINKKIRFEFIGPIPHSKRLKREDVFYHGEIKDFEILIPLFDAASVLVCPSYAEGMPNVILEAMARGLYIIATDVGATNLLVHNEENGKLIPPRNLNRLKEAIEEVSRFDSSTIHEAGLKGKEMVVNKFSWKNVGKETFNQIHILSSND